MAKTNYYCSTILTKCRIVPYCIVVWLKGEYKWTAATPVMIGTLGYQRRLRSGNVVFRGSVRLPQRWRTERRIHEVLRDRIRYVPCDRVGALPTHRREEQLSRRCRRMVGICLASIRRKTLTRWCPPLDRHQKSTPLRFPMARPRQRECSAARRLTLFFLPPTSPLFAPATISSLPVPPSFFINPAPFTTA